MTQGNSKDTIEIRREYYESGALMWEYPFVNGKMHGVARSYYETGVLERETPYVDWVEHGIKKAYYESGDLRLEIPYVNGKTHGIVKNYNREKSNIDCLTLYSNDRILVSLRRES